jgi:two-component system, NtrC family, sensor kinase
MAEARPLKLRFQAKVLIPVAFVVGLFLVGDLWLVSTLIQRQLRVQNKQSLLGMETLVTNAFERHADALLEQLSPRAEESSFYLIAQSLDRDPTNATGRDTMIGRFADILNSTHAEGISVILFTDPAGQLLARTNLSSRLDARQFYSACEPLVAETLAAGKAAVRIIQLGDSLLDVVVVPCLDPDKHTLGALIFGLELTDSVARQFNIPNSEIAFIARNRVAASTFSSRATDVDLLSKYRRLTAPASGARQAEDLDLILERKHFVALYSRFPRFYGYGDAQYLLLSSYEQPWQSFRDNQRDLLLFSALGILVSTTIVWLVVRRVTEPLRQLRDSAEAIGRGDFSKRIEIQPGDELGELAAVFNQTAQNLWESTAKLERTVETLRNTQAQLIHSEKLSAVGEFVAGVAHELNNPLTALIGFAELVQMSNVDDNARASLKRISNSAERCHKIVQSLLSFARQHPPEQKLTNINTIVDSVLEILSYDLRTSNIAVVRELSPNLPRLLVDPHQIQQVFLNIVNNARQAIEASRSRGTVRVTTRAEGERVRIRFQDDGPGISPENLKKIFNPFFTTKPVGKGTGLGLSLSYGIIQEHGGNISAESTPGKGTTFIIDLPITNQAEPVAEVAALVAPPPARGNGRKVLVVDDEEDILIFVDEILRRAGYAIKTATDGQRALDHLGRERFDLIISDWKMPGMSGQQLYQRLLETDPQSAKNMIFMTGDVLSDKSYEFQDSHGNITYRSTFMPGRNEIRHDALVAVSSLPDSRDIFGPIVPVGQLPFDCCATRCRAAIATRTS